METNINEKIPFEELCKQLDGVEKQIAEIEVAIVRLKYDEVKCFIIIIVTFIFSHAIMLSEHSKANFLVQI